MAHRDKKGISTLLVVVVLVVVLVVAVVGVGIYSGWFEGPGAAAKFKVIDASYIATMEAGLETPGSTVDMFGNAIVPSDDLELTDEEKAVLTTTFEYEGLITVFMASTLDVTEVLNKKGMDAALAEVGADPITFMGAGTVQEQINQINTMIAQQNVVVAVVEPFDTKAVATSFADLSEAGTPLVFIWTPVEDIETTANYVCLAADDGYGRGYWCAKMLAYALDGTGQVGMINYALEMFTCVERTRGAHDAFDEYPGIEIVAEEGFTDPADTKDIALGMLQAHPEIDAVWCVWMDPPAYLVSEAVTQLGLEKDVIIAAPDLGGHEGAKRIADPDDPIIGGVESDCVSMGRNAMLAALNYVAGDTSVRNTYTVSASIPVARVNLEDAYTRAMGEPLPNDVKTLLEKPANK